MPSCHQALSRDAEMRPAAGTRSSLTSTEERQTATAQLETLISSRRVMTTRSRTNISRPHAGATSPLKRLDLSLGSEGLVKSAIQRTDYHAPCTRLTCWRDMDGENRSVAFRFRHRWDRRKTCDSCISDERARAMWEWTRQAPWELQVAQSFETLNGHSGPQDRRCTG